mgnify:CR=1 FL=1
MRKVLIIILLVLLFVLAYFTIAEGIEIGDLKIQNVKGIVELNDSLTTKISEANTKIDVDLKQKETELTNNINILLENKESYYKLANVSTESEINKASTEETYDIEYLWVRVGRHARAEGVNMKMDVKTGDAGDQITKNLGFTVEGQYFAIMDFVSILEDDSELALRIEDFHLLPSSGDNLQATFNVTGVRIKLENTTTSPNTPNDAEDGANDVPQ